MSIVKLMIYGGLGYAAYKLLTADVAKSPATEASRAGGRGQSDPARKTRNNSLRRGQARVGVAERISGNNQGMTGGGQGQTVSTHAAGGATTTHRVGRGVR